MLKWTRIGAAAAIAAMTAASLVGCAAGGGGDGTIELQVWNPETDEAELAVFEKVIAAYEKDNPNVNVNLVTIPWADIFTKWQTAIQSGKVPDVSIGSESYAASLHAQGALANLDGVVDSIGGDDAWADSASSIVELSQDDDGYFTVPYVQNSIVLWYNKAMFDAARLEPPTTWDEIESSAAALTKGDEYGFLAPTSTSDVTTQSLYSMVLANGGDIVSREDADNVIFDDEKSTEAVEFYTSLAKYSPPGAGGYDRAQAQAAMTTGKIGMFVYGSWLQSALDAAGPDTAKNFGAVPVPGNGGAEGGSFMGNLSLFAFEKSQHPDEAADFIEYMYQSDLYREFVLLNPSAFFPVLQSVQDSPEYQDNEKVVAQKDLVDAVTAGLPNAWVYGLPNSHAGEWEGLNLVAEAASAVTQEGKTPAEATKAVADQMRESIAK